MERSMLCRRCAKNVLVLGGQKEVTCPHCHTQQPVVAPSENFPRQERVPDPTEYYSTPKHNNDVHWPSHR